MCENYNANSLIYHASKKLIIVVCRMARKLKDKKKHCGMQVQTFNLYMLIRKCQELMKDLSACFILPHKSPPVISDKKSAEDGVLSACSLADRKGQCAKTNSRQPSGWNAANETLEEATSLGALASGPDPATTPAPDLTPPSGTVSVSAKKKTADGPVPYS